MKIISYNKNHHAFFYKDTRILFSYGQPVAAIFLQGKPTEFAWVLKNTSHATRKITNKFTEGVVYASEVDQETINNIPL